MIDLTGYTYLGLTTPGNPAGDCGPSLGTATIFCPGSQFQTYQSHDLYRCGDALHLWRGDWLKTAYEIWADGYDGFVAIAQIAAVRR